MAGSCLGPGLIIDFGTHLRDIVEVDEHSVRVQPGATLQEVQHRLAAVGKRLGPGLSLDGVHTVGGILATTASSAGGRSLVQENVQELRLVLDNGEVAVAQPQPLWPMLEQGGPSHFRDIVQALRVLWEQNEALVREHLAGGRRHGGVSPRPTMPG